MKTPANKAESMGAVKLTKAQRGYSAMEVLALAAMLWALAACLVILAQPRIEAVHKSHDPAAGRALLKENGDG